MKRDTLIKKVDDFLLDDKVLSELKLNKLCRDAIVKFVGDLIYEEVKSIKDSAPMKEAIPESDASVIQKFKHDVGVQVYYVLFKQVKKQTKNSLQVQYGWQYTTLFGKIEEIQIRADHGVLVKINGDWIFQDHAFKSEEEANKRCDFLNDGTLGTAQLGGEGS